MVHILEINVFVFVALSEPKIHTSPRKTMPYPFSAPLKPRSGQTQVLETHVLAQSPAQENASQNLGLARPGFAGR